MTAPEIPAEGADPRPAAPGRWRRWSLFCALYFAQGLPWGFFAIAVTTWLAERGHDAAAIGAWGAVAAIPWGFKWAWGPVLDAIALPGGRRRPWILAAQVGMALTLLGMAALPDPGASLVALGWWVFAHNVCNGLQDVAVDALAVETLAEDERGRANGWMYAAKYLGGSAGGAGMAIVLGRAGFAVAAVVVAAAMIAIAWLPWRMREVGAAASGAGADPTDPTASGALPAGWLRRAASLTRVLLRALTRPAAAWLALVCGTASIAAGVLAAIGPPLYTQRLGWSAEELARLQGGPGLWCGVLGAVAGGWFVDRVGARRGAAVASLALAATWGAFAAAHGWWSLPATVAALTLLHALWMSVWMVSLFALAMAVATPAVAATQFTAYMALLNVGTALGSAMAGRVQALSGPPEVAFLAMAALQVAVTAPLARVRLRPAAP